MYTIYDDVCILYILYDMVACGDALVGAVANAGACSTLSRGRNRHDLQPDICGRHRRRGPPAAQCHGHRAPGERVL